MIRFSTGIVIGAAAAAVLALASSRGSAKPDRAFFNTSLEGTYAVVGNGGANEAASVGVTTFDGRGAASRTLILNEADPNSTGRIILEIPASGSYVVNRNGTGSSTFLNELPDGSKVPFNFDFVITDAVRSHGRSGLIGTRLHMIQREPGIAAKLVVFDLTRLPD